MRDPRFLFEFAKRRLKQLFPFFNMTFRKVPMMSVIQQEIFGAIFRVTFK